MVVELLGSIDPETLDKIQHNFDLARFPVIQAGQVNLVLVEELDLGRLVELCYSFGITVFTPRPTKVAQV